MSRWRKFSHLRATLANWPLAVPDKLGLVKVCRYESREGLTVNCRSRTPDVNEAVVILSGLEYPPRYLHASDGDVVLDLGSNIGCFALYVASLHRKTRFRGIAIEPFHDNFVLLTRNLHANAIQQFTAYQVAISGVDGEALLRTDLPVDQTRLSDEDGDTTVVASLKLSTFCTQQGIERIDLLKMDIEGAEYDVLEADFDFFCSRVARCVLECHELGGDRTVSLLLDRLKPSFALEILHEMPNSTVVYAENKSRALGWQTAEALGSSGGGS